MPECEVAAMWKAMVHSGNQHTYVTRGNLLGPQLRSCCCGLHARAPHLHLLPPHKPRVVEGGPLGHAWSTEL